MARDRHTARNRRALALGLGGALFGHAILLSILPGPSVPIARDLAIGEPPPPLPADLTPTSVIAIDDADIARLPLLTVAGAGDDAAFTGAHPLPDAHADLPGALAADRGGGAAGGPTTWTGRRDPDQTPLYAQLWDGATAYRTPREDLDRRAATSEAIERTPDARYGDRQRRALAKNGDPVASKGALATGTGAGDGAASWQDADPVFDAAAGKTAAARHDGATQRAKEGALADRGTSAVDVERHGATGDDVAVAAASSDRDPDPYDLTPARSGGHDDGVRGATGDGELADGRGHGTGATRAHTATGHGGVSVVASRTDPYLRELLRRLDHAIVFPHDLELDLRSGRVIASMVVRADGSIGDIAVTTSSGFDGFDAELVRALGSLRSLGNVPSALLAGSKALRVIVPYTFRNPMIR